MKKMILLLTLFTLGSYVQLHAQRDGSLATTSSSVKTSNNAVAKFDKQTVDLGDIEIRVPKTADFVLTNDGKEPLIISSAVASCGCTNLKYEKEPILPGKTATISVTYNAAAPGPFSKTITVKTNASAQSVVLMIKGKVVEKKN